MVLQVPFMWHVHEAPYDYYRYTKYGLEYMFKKAGFTAIQIEAQTGFWVNWFVKLNYQLIRIKYNSRKKRFFRKIIHWFINWNQKLGVKLDKKWYNGEGETQGYFVVAKKSCE